MSWPENLLIEHVVGPRLDRAGIIVEAQTPVGKIALWLSVSAAASLSHALNIALVAADHLDLPQFLFADSAASPQQTRRRIRKNPDRTVKKRRLAE